MSALDDLFIEIEKHAVMRGHAELLLKVREEHNRMLADLTQYEIRHEVKDALREQATQLSKAHNREKYWQKVAGKLADIANRMYVHVDERNLTETEVAEVDEMHEYIHKYLEFDESVW